MPRGGLALLLAAFAAAPLTAPAQPTARVPRVGFLANIRSPGTAGFEQGMRELGYVDSRNVIIDWRLAQGRFDRLPELARELVALKVDVIVAPVNVYVEAARQATQTIPIVFALVPDPVASGFVKSLARPGGNLTGLTSIATEVMAKRVEILREAVPLTKRLGVLATPEAEAPLREIDKGAKALGLPVEVAPVSAPHDLESAFAALARQGVSATIEAVGNPLFYQERQLPGPDEAIGVLRGPDPQRGEAGRSPGRAGDQVRAADQSQDRQDAGPDHPPCRSGAGGRADPLTMR